MQMEGKPRLQEIPDEHLEKTKEAALAVYKANGSVHCPYLKTKVHFNARGFDHIRFKEWNKSRTKQEQYVRLKLVKLVPEILSKSHTVQGVWDTQDWERQKKHGKWEKIMRRVTYYEFVAVVGKARIKVIVKRIEQGEPFFWSIIPFLEDE